MYSVFCYAISDSLRSDGGNWVKALRKGADAISAIGGAKVGDSTMLDAMIPAIEAMEKHVAEGNGDSSTLKDYYQLAFQAAETGTKATEDMVAKQGRSSYIGDRTKGHRDPGAEAITRVLRDVAN